MVVTQSSVREKVDKREGALSGSSSEGGEKSCKFGEKYLTWKSNIAILYDWFTNHSGLWPSLCCRYYEFLSFVRNIL